MGPLPIDQESMFGSPLERAEGLLTAFRWADTPQGHDFWEQRFFQLMKAKLRKRQADERAGPESTPPDKPLA
ncbi:hypothetical protein JI739_09760 [Ramlibacter sp. AW1]|uniref:Uncharacterized protein n=1 Tax=Ramlibacter aurantiacus TaxID=2801330 RepID=A0A936ZI34_9BURK|nr:hypothetical protein [Ramlibacter aurantiacus]MBL0420628.1 hypothetical protein [Ramlibacter aurantiacus]